MSATKDENSVAAVSNSEGQFSSRKLGSEPLTTTGHQPGSINSAKDAAPTFSAEAHPAGTAPKENTFLPNPQDEAPPASNYASKGVDSGATTTDAQSTITGATSGDVHTGLGHPGQGQSSAELRHDGTSTGAKQGSGLEGVGASGSTRLAGDRVPGMARGEGQGVDPSDPYQANQRGLDKEGAHTRSGVGETGSAPAAERIPEGAETAAREATS